MDEQFRLLPSLPLEASLKWNQMISQKSCWGNPRMPCYFPHPMKNPTSNHLPLRGQSLFYKTRMCVRFRSGHCPNGDSCNFAHSIEELRRPLSNGVAGTTWLPHEHSYYSGYKQNPKISNGYGSLQDSSGNHNISFRQNSVHWKTKLCYRWSTYGRCPYGDQCNHAHGDAELRKVVGLDHCEVDGKSIATAPSKVSPSLIDDVLPKVKPQPIALPQASSRITTLTLEKCKRIYGDWIDD